MKTSLIANKQLGQHFLNNKKVIQQICESFASDSDAIVEVGPGPGVLTKELAQLALPFYAVEKDSRFEEILTNLLGGGHLLLTDALKVCWPEYVRERQLTGKKIWLVSNLPYNVGVPLFIGSFQCDSFHYLTLMFQKEVGDKFLGNKDMSSLQALANTYFEVKKLCLVSRNSFSPPPDVQSIVVTFIRKENPKIALSEFITFQNFLRTAFSQKRKQIKNVLGQNCPKEQLNNTFSQLDLSPKMRAENLTLENIHQLYFLLREYFESQ